jgi:hypothetical protein
VTALRLGDAPTHGILVAETIGAVLHRCYTGGGSAWYTPAMWAERGEDPLPAGTVVVLTHDGGDLSIYTGDPDAWRQLRHFAGLHGCHVEPLTGWASAIVRDRVTP